MAEYNIEPAPEIDDPELPEILTEPPAGDQLYQALSTTPMHLIPDAVGTVEDRRGDYPDPRYKDAQLLYPALNYKPFHMPYTAEVKSRIDAEVPRPSIVESGPIWIGDTSEVNDIQTPGFPPVMSVYGGKITPEYSKFFDQRQRDKALAAELQRLENYRLNNSRTYIPPDPARAAMVQQALESLMPKRR